MGQIEKAVLTYIHYQVQNSGKLLNNTGSAAWCSVMTLRGGTRDGEGLKEGEDIRVVVQQKLTQNCETILHQLKN